MVKKLNRIDPSIMSAIRNTPSRRLAYDPPTQSETITIAEQLAVNVLEVFTNNPRRPLIPTNIGQLYYAYRTHVNRYNGVMANVVSEECRQFATMMHVWRIYSLLERYYNLFCNDESRAGLILRAEYHCIGMRWNDPKYHLINY